MSSMHLKAGDIGLLKAFEAYGEVLGDRKGTKTYKNNIKKQWITCIHLPCAFSLMGLITACFA